MKRIIRRLLHKNLSVAQLIGFILSNFVGLAIVILGVQFFEDARPTQGFVCARQVFIF